MNTRQIAQKYIAFFEKRRHKQIPNVSLVPEGDSTLLFVNSGMFPLVNYLMGETHPMGTRLVNIQRAVRFEDLDEIGDSRHTIAFHMFGNWSLGDYFKKEQLPWIYEFFVDELKLDPTKFYATVFEGDEDAPKDDVSMEILKEVFARYDIEAKVGERIFSYGKKMNWWQRGDAVGELGGPTSEIFYYVGEGVPETTPEEDEDNFLEIGNSVFLQYQKTENGWEKLSQKNVDFGGGLERLAMICQRKKDIFETDTFWPIIEKIRELSGKNYKEDFEVTKAMRIVADHVRASVFLAMDGVIPSNKDQGYVLRRLIRRMVRFGRKLGVENGLSVGLVGVVCETFSWLYKDLSGKKGAIEGLFEIEEKRFRKVLDRGYRCFDKIVQKLPKDVIGSSDEVGWAKVGFDLYQSEGFPYETFVEDLKEKEIRFNEEILIREIEKLIATHQQKSRVGAEQRFKGGLADQSETVVKYHTTTHLLQRGLINTLGDHIKQIGSNITGERLRFDFTHDQKLTEEDISKVEKFVNDVVERKFPVGFKTMPKEAAVQAGALYLENETYPDTIKVYFVGENLETAISKEFCGGPHVENTLELSPIEIYKQGKIGEGKMRIYARFVEK